MSAPSLERVDLGDELAAFLEREGPSSCDTIARTIRRKRTTVLHTLLDDPRFVQSGRSRATRWRLASNSNGDGLGTDNPGLQSAEGTPQSSAPRWSWERASSRCSDPVLHDGFRAHYDDPYSRLRLCVKCDGGPIPPPLTFNEWSRGEGGEERRQTFENDYRAVVALGRATPEQVERIRYAFDHEEEPTDAG